MLHVLHLPYWTTHHPDLENYHILRLSCPGIAWAVPWKCDITTLLGKPIDQSIYGIELRKCSLRYLHMHFYLHLCLPLSLRPSLSPYLWIIGSSLSALCLCWGWKGSAEQIQHMLKVNWHEKHDFQPGARLLNGLGFGYWWLWCVNVSCRCCWMHIHLHKVNIFNIPRFTAWCTKSTI